MNDDKMDTDEHDRLRAEAQRRMMKLGHRLAERLGPRAAGGVLLMAASDVLTRGVGEREAAEVLAVHVALFERHVVKPNEPLS